MLVSANQTFDLTPGSMEFQQLIGGGASQLRVGYLIMPDKEYYYFSTWFAKEQGRFHCGQFSDEQIAFSAFVEGVRFNKERTQQYNPTDQLQPGVSCGHPGCLHHVKHPCEKCGRTAGR